MSAAAEATLVWGYLLGDCDGWRLRPRSRTHCEDASDFGTPTWLPDSPDPAELEQTYGWDAVMRARLVMSLLDVPSWEQALGVNRRSVLPNGLDLHVFGHLESDTSTLLALGYQVGTATPSFPSLLPLALPPGALDPLARALRALELEPVNGRGAQRSPGWVLGVFYG